MTPGGGGDGGVAARRLAVEALVRVEEGSYANLVLPPMLERSTLVARDRHFVTELVYGSTRMRRACDWAVDRFLDRPVEPVVRAALRVGAYQLVFLGTPAHAAVATTVEAAPARARGLVNAVLRRVAATPPAWPDRATALSYPDWMVARLVADLGEEDAAGALAAMNRPPEVTVRPDGYVQDRASQWVAERVGVQPGDLVVDVCAAPGGKATLMGAAGGRVVAVDVREHRARLVAANARRVRAHGVKAVVADGRRLPLQSAVADRVLVDAPCSGLGVLARRPDARWRVQPRDVDALAALQRELLDAAVDVLRPGGQLVYSVCTLTVAETVAIDVWMAAAHPDFVALPPPDAPWAPAGRGARLLPQTTGTDGMFVVAYTAPPARPEISC